MMVLPKFWFENCWHSPLIAGSRRSQSGMKSPLRSVQPRFVLGFDAASGLFASAVLRISSPMYRPRLAFTAVLPVPNRSRITLPRGDQSFQHGTQ